MTVSALKVPSASDLFLPSSCSLSVVKAFLDHASQVGEQLAAFADVGRPVHDSQRFRFECGQTTQDAFGLTRVRHVIREWARLHLLHRLACRIDQVRSRHRGDVAEMMEQVGAKERLARFLKKHPRVPAVGQMRRAMKPVTILTRGEDIVSRHTTRRADGEVVHGDELADERADGLGLRREFQPVIERANFVGFKVAPGDVSEFRGINQRRDGFPQSREHPLESSVKEQRFLVAHEEVIELHIKVRDVDGKTEKVGGNFVDGGHGIGR